MQAAMTTWAAKETPGGNGLTTENKANLGELLAG